MSTFTTIHLNCTLPLSIPYKLAYQEARKTVKTTPMPALSLSPLSSDDSEADPAADFLDSGASVLLAIHRRREKSTAPSQKMTRKEQEYLETDANPSLYLPNMRSPKKLAPPSTRKMTKKQKRGSLLDSALDLLSED
jgi:hypothetical protein